MNNTHSKNLPYYSNLDGLRGIAALMVVIFHFFYFFQYDNSILFSKLTEFGQHGVSLFFVLSGFVITRILFNTKHDKNYFKNFYIRRSLRIFPLYYLASFIWFYIMPVILQTYSFPGIDNQIVSYFYLQNIPMFKGAGPPHFWSLAVEEHFYLIWPLLIYITPRNKFKILVICCLLIFMVIKIIMIYHNYPIEKFTLTRIDQIILGSILAYKESKNILISKKKYVITCVIGLVCGISIYFGQRYIHNLYLFSKYYVLGIFFYGLIGFVLSLKDTSFINKFLNSRGLQFLGKLSYGIYVWHYFIQKIQSTYLNMNYVFLDLCLNLILTIIVSYLSFRYWEFYFIKLKSKFSYNKST